MAAQHWSHRGHDQVSIHGCWDVEGHNLRARRGKKHQKLNGWIFSVGVFLMSLFFLLFGLRFFVFFLGCFVLFFFFCVCVCVWGGVKGRRKIVVSVVCVYLAEFEK